MATFRSLVSLTLNYNCISDDCWKTCATTTPAPSDHEHQVPHSRPPRAGHLGHVLGRKAGRARHQPEEVSFFFRAVMKYEHGPDPLAGDPHQNISLRSCYFSGPDWSIGPTLTDLPAHLSAPLQVGTTRGPGGRGGVTASGSSCLLSKGERPCGL